MGRGYRGARFVTIGIAVGISTAMISTANMTVRPASAGVGGGVDFTTVAFDPAHFSHPTVIDNEFLPLIPGHQIVLEGVADRGRGGPTAHKVIFTVTDLTKVVAGVRTVVVWDQDINVGDLSESELALFAQDDDGNVWNLGEYPEEMKSGVITGAPSTWLHGTRTNSTFALTCGGIHVHRAPVPGSPIYLAGDAPSIDFLDVAQVESLSASKCAGAVCDDQLLYVREWDPLAQPDDGYQLKYYQRNTGLFRVDPEGGVEQETLVRTALNVLSPSQLAAARTAAVAIDNRAVAKSSSVWYRSTKVAQATAPGAPTAVAAVVEGAAAKISWAPPLSDGGAVVTGYTVTATPGGAVRSTSSTNVVFDGLTSGVEYRFAVSASNVAGGGPSSTSNAVIIPVVAPPPPLPPARLGFSAVEPGRLVDSRAPGGRTIDGVLAAVGLRDAGSVTEVVVAGRGGVPADAAAAELNLTVVGAKAAGYVTVWPCGSDKPNASNVNFAAGATVANSVLVKVGAGGKVCVFLEAATDLIVDVAGYFPDGASFVAIEPARFVDTRTGGRTADGVFAAVGARTAGSITDIAVGGRSGVPPTASAVALNLTVTGAQAAGYLTVWPCGDEMPNVSNLNFAAGATVANSALVKLGEDARVCVYSEAATDLIVDVTGYFPPGVSTEFTAMRPGRIVDTRKPGGRTIDGVLAATGARQAGATTEVLVGGRAGVATDVVAVSLNLTVTGAANAGYLTVWPCGTEIPNASNLNFAAGATVANSALVRAGSGGKVCVFTEATTDLIVDVTGYFTA